MATILQWISLVELDEPLNLLCQMVTVFFEQYLFTFLEMKVTTCLCELKFEQINEYIFAKFLMPPVNKPSFQEHIEFLQRPGSWATQVEVLTVATMFQVPVYYCKSSQDDVYYWEVTNPLKCKSPANEESLDDVFYMAKIPHHFELMYWDRSHYDCVVVQTTGVCSSSATLLTGTKSYIDITNN